MRPLRPGIGHSTPRLHRLKSAGAVLFCASRLADEDRQRARALLAVQPHWHVTVSAAWWTNSDTYFPRFNSERCSTFTNLNAPFPARNPHEETSIGNCSSLGCVTCIGANKIVQESQRRQLCTYWPNRRWPTYLLAEVHESSDTAASTSAGCSRATCRAHRAQRNLWYVIRTTRCCVRAVRAGWAITVAFIARVQTKRRTEAPAPCLIASVAYAAPVAA
jgi:hypothetical protein